MLALELPGLTDYAWNQLAEFMISEYGEEIEVADELAPLITPQ